MSKSAAAVTLTIKSIGYKVGTSGWLKAGLADGSITICEGTSEAGKHGLWLAPVGHKSLCLALYDPYGCECKYRATDICLPIWANYSPGQVEDHIGLTPAAKAALTALGKAWAARQNEARTNDEGITLTAVYA